MKNLGIRARTIILVVLAALPMLAGTIYGAWDERVRAVTGARKDIQRLADLAAQHQAQVIEGAKQTLVAVSLIPTAVRNDSARCNAYLATLLAKSAGLYHSIGIYGTDGYLQCNSMPWQGQVYSPDRLYFRLVLASGKFSIGEYQVGRVTKLKGINLGYPMTDAHGAVTGVAFVALDLDSLNAMAAAMPLPEQGVLAVVDCDGIILARKPSIEGRVGEKIQYPNILKAVLASRAGEFGATIQGNLDRLVAFNSIAVNPDGSIPMRVVVSVPSSVILADANRALVRNIAVILGAIVLLLLGAWYGGEVFMLRPIRALLDGAARVESGNLSARTGLGEGKDELARLGGAFDSMASALQARDADLQRALRDLEQQAITDPLTGLHNRRYLWDLLGRELLKAGRAGKTVAAILLDIDQFKRFNDTWGHEAGDLVLTQIADVIRKQVRGSDIACRYGGEELLVILPETTAEAALGRAESIRRAIAGLRLDYEGKALDGVTISLGMAVFPQHADDASALVRAADSAMYDAKKAGGDRVLMALGAGVLR
jgi:diguanylate cyclase (GGDEF)-like protein